MDPILALVETSHRRQHYIFLYGGQRSPRTLCGLDAQHFYRVLDEDRLCWHCHRMVLNADTLRARYVANLAAVIFDREDITPLVEAFLKFLIQVDHVNH